MNRQLVPHEDIEVRKFIRQKLLDIEKNNYYIPYMVIHYNYKGITD